MEQKRKTKISKIYDSKVFWIVVSVLFALVMWTYVTSMDATDDYSRTLSGIPVVFEGEDELLAERNLSITNVDTETVSIVVSGTRSNISQLRASDITAVIDVSDITEANNMTWTYSLVFPSNISESDITVVRKTPDTVNFTVVKNGSKTVEIKGSFEGTIADGCVAEEFSFEPAAITVEGPDEIISRIDHAWVEFGEDQTIDSAYVEEAQFTLRDANDNVISKDGLVISNETITATQTILKSKELPLKVTLVSGGGLTADDCTVTIDPEAITVAGDSRILDEMEYIDLGTVNLSALSGSYEQTFQIVLDDGLENITGITEATVTIVVSSTYSKTFTTTNIACKGVTAGYHVTIDTKEVEVTLRAVSESTLDAISASDITIVADLSDYGSTTGQIIVPAEVSVIGYDSVGAVGDVRVTVTISKD